MRRVFLVAAIGAVLVGQALAVDKVRCADAAGEISFEYDLDDTASLPVTRVAMQLTGDFGLSTVPDERNHDGEYVESAFVGDDVEGATVAWRDDKGRVHRAMTFRVGRVFEARQALLAGAVSVGGGGLWAVTCTSSDLGM